MPNQPWYDEYKKVANPLGSLVEDAKRLPVTPQYREGALIVEFLQQQIASMDAQAALRDLAENHLKYATQLEEELATERTSNRKQRIALRELASRWSRRVTAEGCGRTNVDRAWEQAEKELSAILDADL